MKEVSPKAYRVLLNALMSRGVSPLEWIGTLPVSLKGLQDAQSSLDWDIFAVLCDRFAALYGDMTVQGLESWLSYPHFLHGSPQRLYHQIEKRTGPALASNLVYRYEALEPNRLKLTVEIPEPYQPSPAFLTLFGEALRCVPRLIDQAEAVVEATVTPRQAAYLVTLPSSLNLWGRLRMAYFALFDPRPIQAEARHRQKWLQTLFQELAAARQVIARQEWQLDLTARWERRLADCTRLEELGEVLIQILNREMGCQGIALWVQTGADTRLLLRHGELSDKPAQVYPLRVGDKTVGRLDIWCQDQWIEKIVERWLPMLSLALHTNCLAERFQEREAQFADEHTELERAVEEVRLAEERWRLLVEDAPVILSILDRQGTILYMNRTYSGMPLGRVIGTSIYDYSPLEFHEEITRAIRRAEKTGDWVRYEHVSTNEQGGLAWFESRMRPVIRKGKAVNFTLISADITERRNNEREIHKRALEMQTFAEVSSEIIQTLDPDDLMQRVCELTQKRFDLYYVQIYLLDESGRTLTVSAGTGTAGQNLIRSKWSFTFNTPKQGLVVQAALRRHPVVSNDVSKDKRFFYNVYLPRTRSEMALPMIVGDRLIGVLDVQSDKTNRFSEVDVRVMGTLAAQVAVALNNAQLFVKLRRQREISDTLRDISVVLNSTLDLPILLQQILDQVKRVLPYDAANVRLDNGTGRFYPVAWVGYERFGNPGIDYAPVITSEESRLLRVMMAEKRSLIISDVTQEPQWMEVSFGYDWVQSIAGTPIIVDDRLLGMVTLDHAQPGFYTTQHLPLLESLRIQVSIAVTNARLFEAERRRRQEIESVQRSSLSLTSLLELPQVLDAIVHAVVDLTKADDVHVFLYDGVRLQFGAGLHMGEPLQQAFIDPRPNGVTYHVARTGEPFIVSNMNQHPLYQGHQFEFMSAIMGLPLKIGERVVGVMNIVYTDPHNFEDVTLQALQLLVNQASIAIENAHLYEEVRREREIAETLRDIGLVVNSTLDLSDVLQRILGQVERVLPYDVASIRLKDENGTFRVVKSARSDQVVAYGDDDTLLLPSLKPTAISDVRTDPRGAALAKHPWIRSWLGAPIAVRDEVIGAFTLAALEANAYGARHEPVMGALATQVSIAVANAQSFEAERRRLQELEAVQKSSLSLTGSLQLPQVLDAIIESIANLIHPESINIFLYEGSKLEFGAAMLGKTRLNKPPLEPRPDGVTYQVARTGKMLKVGNVQEHPIYEDTAGQWADALNSIISLPLKIGDRVVGVMNITYRQTHEYTDAELQTLQLLASHASIAIENARLYQTISDYAEQLADRVRERTYELERERAQLQAILDSMGEGLIYDEDLDIKYYNRALLDITGFENPQWDTHYDFWGQLVPDDKKRTELMHAIYTAIGKHEPWRGEVTMMHYGGTPFAARITCHPVQDARGDVTGAVMLIQDVSADKELQAQKDRFIAHASHELRTPLANLKTRLYLFKRSPEKQDYHLRVMENVADQMSELVEDLLDLSRFERGIMEMNQDWHILQDLLDSVYEIQAPEAEKKQITFTKELPEESVRAWVDFKRLRQVVTNLVVNAINYTPAGGVIAFRLVVDGDFVEIHVHDNGIGIPPEFHEQVFQPFFRATQGAERGTGLGLAISHQIVDLHRGEILLESVPGSGSIFKVRLPIHPPKEKE